MLEKAFYHLPKLPRYNLLQMSEDSIEFQVYNTTWTHQMFIFDQMGPLLETETKTATSTAPLTRFDTISIAKTIADTITTDTIPFTKHNGDADVFWHLAIVYGQHSVFVPHSAFDMLEALENVLRLRPGDETAHTIVSQRVNPYTQLPIDE